MPRVQKFDVKKGTSCELNVTDKVWKRITQVPSIFGANLRWKLVPQLTPGAQPQFDTGATHAKNVVNDDLAEPSKVEYGEEAYTYDIEQGKRLTNTGELSQALEFLERALLFKPKNPHLRGLIKKIKDGQSTAD
jgi:hypothetical protein